MPKQGGARHNKQVIGKVPTNFRLINEKRARHNKQVIGKVPTNFRLINGELPTSQLTGNV